MTQKIRVLVNSVFFFFACLICSHTYAQPSGDDVSSIYDYKNYGHVSSPYTGIIPYLVFGALIIFLSFVGYRYLHDHAQE